MLFSLYRKIGFNQGKNDYLVLCSDAADAVTRTMA
jgi:hypothetical protein